MPRTLHKWTQEELEIVIRDYRGSHQSRREIADKLGVTEFAVAGQIAKLGIANSSDRRPWTPQEDLELAELTSQLSNTQIAKRMKRSVNSVTVRAKRLGCSRRIRDDWYTIGDAAGILGKDRKWVRCRVQDGRLKARHHHHQGRNRDNAPPRATWHISRKDLRTFLQTYPHELTARNVDLVAVVDILVGLKKLN